MARRQSLIPTDTLPTPEERLELFETASRLFAWDGYKRVGIDHFARPEDGLAMAARSGRLRRNFQGYTDDASEVLIGLGASAISRFPQGYAQNSAATSTYQGRIGDGVLATERGAALSSEDRLVGGMIEALMCDFRIDVAALATRLGVVGSMIEERLSHLEDAFPGLVRQKAGVFEIFEAGRPLTRLIARRLDRYRKDSAAHSVAI